MKNILLVTLLLLCRFSVQAQLDNVEKIDRIEKKIDSCGCKNAESPDAEGAYEKISETFGAKDKAGKKVNEVAINLLKRISDTPNKNRQEPRKWIEEALKDKKWDNLRKDSSLLNALKALENKETDLNQAKLNVICLLSKEMHKYYITNDANLKEVPGQENYYNKIFNKATDTIKADTIATKPAAQVTESSSADFSFAWILAICSLLANAGLAFMWYSEKKKHQNHSENTASSQIELNEKLKEKEAQIKKLEVQLAQSEQKVETIKRELDQKNLIITELNNSSKTIQEELVHISDNRELPQIHKYLLAPTSEGVFYQTNIKENKTSDTFYKIVLAHNNADEADLFLLTDLEILNRAESAPQDYLISACDLQGRGKINPTGLNMTAGTVKREGGGWRITKKITLKW